MNTMRSNECQSTRREVEAANPGDLLSSAAHDHLKGCQECGVFRDEEWKLRTLVSSLGTVTVPADFDFRLRARLAGDKPGAASSISFGNFSFGYRSVAFAAVLLIGVALLLVGLRAASEKVQVANQTASETTPPSISVEVPAATNSVKPLQNSGEIVANTDAGSTVNVENQRPAILKAVASDSSKAHRDRGRLGTRSAETLAVRDAGRVQSLDLASTPAKVFKSTSPGTEPLLSNAFPIGTSYQSLKVSLDDGRGSSRTISLPSVSFGSQRVLERGAVPVLASARGSW